MKPATKDHRKCHQKAAFQKDWSHVKHILLCQKENCQEKVVFGHRLVYGGVCVEGRGYLWSQVRLYCCLIIPEKISC